MSSKKNTLNFISVGRHILSPFGGYSPTSMLDFQQYIHTNSMKRWENCLLFFLSVFSCLSWGGGGGGWQKKLFNRNFIKKFCIRSETNHTNILACWSLWSLIRIIIRKPFFPNLNNFSFDQFPLHREHLNTHTRYIGLRLPDPMEFHHTLWMHYACTKLNCCYIYNWKKKRLNQSSKRDNGEAPLKKVKNNCENYWVLKSCFTSSSNSLHANTCTRTVGAREKMK